MFKSTNAPVIDPQGAQGPPGSIGSMGGVGEKVRMQNFFHFSSAMFFFLISEFSSVSLRLFYFKKHCFWNVLFTASVVMHVFSIYREKPGKLATQDHLESLVLV